MVTIDPMHRMPQIYLSADPHRYAANTSFSHSFSKNIPRSAFRTSMLRPFQLIYCFFSKIFHMSLLKSTDFLGIVQIDRHGLLLFLFCGDSKIEPMSVFFKLVFPYLSFSTSIPVRNRRRTQKPCVSHRISGNSLLVKVARPLCPTFTFKIIERKDLRKHTVIFGEKSIKDLSLHTRPL